ncbi:MAG: HipA N-terminal domain-containing protein [Ignavibacteriaceae bacterium]|nr:HipA N-terminal domain-containing protein [Ignavibacteriaceae bacterium]
MKNGKVFYKNEFAGIISEDENGYSFTYKEEYLNSANPKAVSFTLPLQKESFRSKTMFPFFDGLIPEGWLLEIAEKNWKINSRNRMSLLLTFCKDCIGAVSVIPIEKEAVK